MKRAKDVTARARRIRLVVLDVDGVLTDGGIYLGDVAGARHEFKRYDIQDGLGIYFLRSAGLIPVIVTGRVSMSVELRARELGIARQRSHRVAAPGRRDARRADGVTRRHARRAGDAAAP